MLRRSRDLLDRVQTAAALEQFNLELFGPEPFDQKLFWRTLREELPPPEPDDAKLAATFEALAALAVEIDRFAEKAMRIRLHASIAGLPRQLQLLFQSTVLAYASDLALLRQRAAAALARVDAPGALEAIMAAAGEVIATHAALRDGLAALTRETAAAWLPVAERAAGERWQSAEHLGRWQARCEELAKLVG